MASSTTATVGSAVPRALGALGHHLTYEDVESLRRLKRTLRLFTQMPGTGARLPTGTVLTMRVGPEVPDTLPPLTLLDFLEGGVKRPLPLEDITSGLRLAAHDPRIGTVLVVVESLQCGWARVLEIRRYLQYCADAGKKVLVFMEAGGPKEFFLGMGFTLYVPPMGGLMLNGFAVQATFYRGIFDKIGVNPQVERIGAYKSFGDSLDRTSMSDKHREVLSSILNEINDTWVTSVAEACGVSEQVVKTIVERAPIQMEEYLKAGLVAGLKDLSDIHEMLVLEQHKKKADDSDSEILLANKLNSVTLKNYCARNTEKTLGLEGSGKKVGIIRASGFIVSGKSGNNPGMGESIGADSLVKLLRRAKMDKSIAAVVIRIDSPGGSALASDIVYREVRRLREVKPVVASMGDVAASGGYYIAMGASDIVAECLTLTGSVGVVVAKAALGKLYDKVGYGKQSISVGKYAEIQNDERDFNQDEATYWRDYAEYGYKSFVSAAADARGKSYEQMHEVAQGRVWTGRQALQKGMIDHIGGLRKAIEVAAEKAGVDARYVPTQSIKQPTGLLRLLLGASDEFVSTPSQFGITAPLVVSELDPLLGSGGPSPVVRFVTAATAALPQFSFLNTVNRFANSSLMRVLGALCSAVANAFQ